MAMSLISALMIRGNDVKCVSMGPFEDGKYGGVVYMLKDEEINTPIVSIDKGKFDTSKEAVEHLEMLVEAIRAADLSPQEDRIKEDINEVISKIEKEKNDD